jgi:hypothetical protein
LYFVQAAVKWQKGRNYDSGSGLGLPRERESHVTVSCGGAPQAKTAGEGHLRISPSVTVRCAEK